MGKINKGLVVLLVSILVAMVMVSPFSVLAHEKHQENYQAEKIEITIKVVMDEYLFQVEGQKENTPIILKIGQRVEIEFENIGFVEHEVMFGREVLYEEDKPYGYKENLLQDTEVGIKAELNGKFFKIEAEGLIELELGSETSIKIEFTVPDKVGEWELGCFILGHYEAGMYASLIIK